MQLYISMSLGSEKSSESVSLDFPCHRGGTGDHRGEISSSFSRTLAAMGMGDCQGLLWTLFCLSEMENKQGDLKKI